MVRGSPKWFRRSGQSSGGRRLRPADLIAASASDAALRQHPEDTTPPEEPQGGPEQQHDHAAELPADEAERPALDRAGALFPQQEAEQPAAAEASPAEGPLEILPPARSERVAAPAGRRPARAARGRSIRLAGLAAVVLAAGGVALFTFNREVLLGPLASGSDSGGGAPVVDAAATGSQPPDRPPLPRPAESAPPNRAAPPGAASADAVGGGAGEPAEGAPLSESIPNSREPEALVPRRVRTYTLRQDQPIAPSAAVPGVSEPAPPDGQGAASGADGQPLVPLRVATVTIDAASRPYIEPEPLSGTSAAAGAATGVAGTTPEAVPGSPVGVAPAASPIRPARLPRPRPLF